MKLSTAHHAQTDGQTEVMNQYMDQRLRPFVNHYQDDWDELLPMMDYAQFTLLHATTGLSGFEIVDGYAPRTSFDWQLPKPSTPREELNQKKAQQIARRMEEALGVAQRNMEKAQERMTTSANRKRRVEDFEVGDYVG